MTIESAIQGEPDEFDIDNVPISDAEQAALYEFTRGTPHHKAVRTLYQLAYAQVNAAIQGEAPSVAIQAHSKSQYKRLSALGADVAPPLPDLAAVLEALEKALTELRPATAYGVVGSRDVDQARYRAAVDAGLAAIASLRASMGAQEGVPAIEPAWQDIATAPKDGSHILVCSAKSTFGWMDGKPLPAWQTVVHWWGHGEPGFYTSVNESEPKRPFPATHWKPLDSPTGGV